MIIVSIKSGAPDEMHTYSTRHRAVEFSDALQLEGVSLYGCRPPAVTTPLTPPPTPLPPPPSIRPNITIGLDGSSGSFLAYPITEAQVVNR